MIVGFTGSRSEPTAQQLDWLRETLVRVRVTEFHHGDCIGADAAAHTVVRRLGPEIRVVIHPPTNPQYRAFCFGDETLPEAEYLERNRVIVRSCKLLLALPSGPEYKRSGTWSTIRFARRLRKERMICLPDGSVRSTIRDKR